MDKQFHDTIEVVIELESPYKRSAPKAPPALNEFGIPVKTTYRTADVAALLGIGGQQLRERFFKGQYADVARDAAGRRVFSIEDIRRLVAEGRPSPEKQRKEREVRDSLIHKLFAEGMRMTEIARRVGVSHSMVSLTVNGKTVKHPRAKPQVRKVRDEEILRLFSEGYLQVQIAKHMNVSTTLVHCLIRRKFRPSYKRVITKREIVAEFLMKNGPTKRRDIEKRTGLAQITVSNALMHKEIFRIVDGRWDVLESFRNTATANPRTEEEEELPDVIE